MKYFIIIIFITIANIHLSAQNYWQEYYLLENTYSNAANVLSFNDTSFIVANTYYNTTNGENGLEIVCFSYNKAIVWQKNYDIYLQIFQSVEFGQLIQTLDGGFAFVIFEAVSDYWYDNVYLMKFDNLGNLEWNKYYGKAYTSNRAYNLYQTSDSSLVMSGFAINEVGEADIYALKTTSIGDTIWIKRFEEENFQRARIIQEDYDGAYILGGVTGISNWMENDGLGTADGLILKLNKDGTERWRLNIGTEDDDCDAFVMPCTDEAGKYIVWSCDGNSYRNQFGVINYNDTNEAKLHYISKIDSTGFVYWRTDVELYNEEIRKVVELPNGDFLALGSNTSCGDSIHWCSPELGWLARISSEGELLWSHTYQNYEEEDTLYTRFNWFTDAIPAADGGLIVVGRHQHKETWSSASIPHVWLLKVDENGCLAPNCSATDSLIFVSTADVILPMREEWKVRVFPNPVANDAHIILPAHLPKQAAEIQIWNINGQLVKQIDIAETAFSVDFSTNELPNGVYLLQYLSNEKQISSTKLVVQH